MKVLIAMLLAAGSISASAVPLCLGRAQAGHVPDELNLRFELEFDAANPGRLILNSYTYPSHSYVFNATGDVLPRRRASHYCGKLVEDYQRERLTLAMQRGSDHDRLFAVILLSIGMNRGMNISSGNLCSLLGESRTYQLEESLETPKASALLGKHILVSNVDDQVILMEGSLGFIYHQQACVQPRLK